MKSVSGPLSPTRMHPQALCTCLPVRSSPPLAGGHTWNHKGLDMLQAILDLLSSRGSYLIFNRSNGVKVLFLTDLSKTS